MGVNVMKSEHFVSVVLSVDKKITGLVEKVKPIQYELDRLYSDYEIVIMAQGPLATMNSGNEADKILQQIRRLVVSKMVIFLLLICRRKLASLKLLL